MGRYLRNPEYIRRVWEHFWAIVLVVELVKIRGIRVEHINTVGVRVDLQHIDIIKCHRRREMTHLPSDYRSTPDIVCVCVCVCVCAHARAHACVHCMCAHMHTCN